MRKIIQKITLMLLVSALVLSPGAGILTQAGQTDTVSEVTPKKIKVSKSSIKKLGARDAIQKALDQAKKKATDQKPYVITVPAGKYNVNGTLRIFSNTTLVLNKVTLTENKKDSNLIHVGEFDKQKKGVKGYYYKNIAIEGGVLNGKKVSGTIVKVGHTQNFKMTGVTLKNTVDAHIMEAAGVDGFTLTNCTFKDQKVSANAKTPCNEAVQLDILYPTHMSNYRAEDLKNQNITIDNCTFSNVPRGVGSHTSVINNPMENITITNCTFKKINGIAIQPMNWKNVDIANNTITNALGGIHYQFVIADGKGSFTAAQLKKKGGITTSTSSKYETPDEDLNVVIRDNQITLTEAKDYEYERSGILVSGSDVQKNGKYSDESAKLPKGNYYPSGITVQNNTITSTGHGVRLVDARNIKILSNTINCLSAADHKSVNYYGIVVNQQCQGITLDANSISNADCNGIYVCRNSAADAITNNTISSTGKYGISIDSSSAGIVTGNTISNTQHIGIAVLKNAAVTDLSNNTLLNTKKYGVQIAGNSKVGTVTNNTIDNPGDYGIIISSNSSADTVTGNTITNFGKKSVHVAKGCTVTTLDDAS